MLGMPLFFGIYLHRLYPGLTKKAFYPGKVLGSFGQQVVWNNSPKPKNVLDKKNLSISWLNYLLQYKIL